MKPITQEWVDKAEADFSTAQRELAVQNQRNNDAICFHAHSEALP
jgi:HEPN domain-containing protein